MKIREPSLAVLISSAARHSQGKVGSRVGWGGREGGRLEVNNTQVKTQMCGGLTRILHMISERDSFICLWVCLLFESKLIPSCLLFCR